MVVWFLRSVTFFLKASPNKAVRESGLSIEGRGWEQGFDNLFINISLDAVGAQCSGGFSGVGFPCFFRKVRESGLSIEGRRITTRLDQILLFVPLRHDGGKTLKGISFF